MPVAVHVGVAVRDGVVVGVLVGVGVIVRVRVGVPVGVRVRVAVGAAGGGTGVCQEWLAKSCVQ